MPASASAAAITRSSICNDAVGFAVDASAAASAIPGAGCGAVSTAGWLLCGLGVLLLVGGWLGDRGNGLHIGRVACGICTLIVVEPSARGQRSWREHVRPMRALAILNRWRGGRGADRLRPGIGGSSLARRGIAGRPIRRARRRSPCGVDRARRLCRRLCGCRRSSRGGVARVELVVGLVALFAKIPALTFGRAIDAIIPMAAAAWSRPSARSGNRRR